MSPVYTIENECQDCYKCVRHCPVKAIRIVNGKASVIITRFIAALNVVFTQSSGPDPQTVSFLPAGR